MSALTCCAPAVATARAPGALYVDTPHVCAGCEGALGPNANTATGKYPDGLEVTAAVCGACFARLGRDAVLSKRLNRRFAALVSLYRRPARGHA